MRNRTQTTVGIVAIALTMIGGGAEADTYPSRPIRVVIPWPVGGLVDVAMRVMSDKLREDLGQPMVIDNRTGAGGVIGSDIVARAKSDGYTILFTSAGLNMNAALGAKLPYDVRTAFVPIVKVASAPMVLVAHPSLKLKSVKDLIAMAEARPDTLKYAIIGYGSPAHFTAEMFRSATGIKAIAVSYKGSTDGMTDQLAGRVDFTFANSVVSLPQVKEGRLTGLAVTSSKRLEIAPELPTMAESGFPHFQASQWLGIFAPKDTPLAIVERLAVAVNKAIKHPDTPKGLAPYAMEVDGTSTPKTFAAEMPDDLQKWTKVVRDANIKVPQ